jgi:hypothetical protein
LEVAKDYWDLWVWMLVQLLFNAFNSPQAVAPVINDGDDDDGYDGYLDTLKMKITFKA